MSKIFYDHLILLEDILSELDKFVLESESKAELIDLIDQNLHHHTLNVILNHLPQEHHTTFLNHFKAFPHDPALMKFLKKEIKVDIEAAIKTQANRIKSDVLLEIKKSRSRRP